MPRSYPYLYAEILGILRAGEPTWVDAWSIAAAHCHAISSVRLVLQQLAEDGKAVTKRSPNKRGRPTTLWRLRTPESEAETKAIADAEAKRAADIAEEQRLRWPETRARCERIVASPELYSDDAVRCAKVILGLV